MLQDIPTPTLREARPCVLETERLLLRRPTLADVKADRASRRRSPHCGKYPPAAASLWPGPCDRVRPHHRRRQSRHRIPDRKRFLADRHGRLSTGASRMRRNSATGSASSIGGRGFGTEAARAVIDFTFEEFDTEHLMAGARVTNPSSRNILEKCGFQWSGVELHRFEALGSSTPVDCFRLSRGVWSSLKNWSSSTKRER